MNLRIDPEFKQLMPPLSPEERESLEASLKAEGCRHAIDTWNGVIIDGHNRYELCTKHGIAFQTKAHEFSDRSEATLWIMNNQLARRNLSAYQRGALVLRMKPLLAAQAKARMAANTGRLTQPVENLPQGKTRDQLGVQANVSGKTISMVETVERDAPEPIKQAARTGGISTHRAYELTRALQDLPEEYRERAGAICVDHDEKARILVRLHKSSESPESSGTFGEILRTGGFHYGNDLEQWCDFQNASVREINETLQSLAKHHKKLAFAAKIEDQRRAIAEGGIDVPTGVFEIIVVDPPWPYGSKYDPGGRRSANPYPEMSLEEIAAIELPAADDCVLWLWTTHKFMRHSFALLDSWGFADVSIVTWVKNRMGTGSWLRSQSEFCIMAVKGKPLIHLTNQTTVINGPLREHSRKPDEFYNMVDALCVGRKLDYFSREKRDGWEQLGNDITKF